jgi:hypothetical protein
MPARSLFLACRSRASIVFAPRTRAHLRPLVAGWLASGLSQAVATIAKGKSTEPIFGELAHGRVGARRPPRTSRPDTPRRRKPPSLVGPGLSTNSRRVDLSRFRLYGLDRLTVIQLDVGAHSGGFELGQRQSEHGESLAAEETIWIRQRFSSSSSFCSCSVAAAGMAADAGSKLSQRSFGSRSGSRDEVFGS